MAQTSHADGGWLICPLCRYNLLSDVIEMVAKDVLHFLEQPNERVFSDVEIGETMANYYVKKTGPPVKDIACELVPSAADGLLLRLEGFAIQRLRPDGTIQQYAISPERAAQLGLQLDDKGYVLCV